jgi:hypothetical protein
MKISSGRRTGRLSAPSDRLARPSRKEDLVLLCTNGQAGNRFSVAPELLAREFLLSPHGVPPGDVSGRLAAFVADPDGLNAGWNDVAAFAAGSRPLTAGHPQRSAQPGEIPRADARYSRACAWLLPRSAQQPAASRDGGTGRHS